MESNKQKEDGGIDVEKKNTGKIYEEIVQEVYQAILNYENSEKGYKKIEVQHNIELVGKTGNMHQIDVFWSFELGGIEYKTIVEVKDWKGLVKKEQIHSFKSLLDDIPGFPKGCFVSKSGFQKGAIVAAQHHGIELVTINEETPIRGVVLDSIITFYDGVELDVDENWCRQKRLDDLDLARISSGITQEEAILLAPNNNYIYLYDLMCDDARPYYYAPENEKHTLERRLEGAWFLLTEDLDIPQLKITNYKFTCHNKWFSMDLPITVKGIPQYIITNVIEGKQSKYDPVTHLIQERVTQNNTLKIEKQRQ